jgi:ribulose-phosphate 3-epimerase
VLPHLHRTLGFIKSLGAQAGAVLNPSTPVGCLEEVAADVDFVLIMTVNPGFGGQAFIPRSTSKVRAMRALLDGAGNAAPIEVDGGIDEHNIGRLVAAGADWIVAGTSVFGSDDAEASTRRLKALAVEAAQARLAGSRGPR